MTVVFQKHLRRAVLAVAFMAGLTSGPARAQQDAPPVQALSQPLPDDVTMAKLVWSTMIAVEQANQSGNYSVLRDLSATGFQQNNDQAKLAQIFAALRASRIDLADTLLVPPSFTAPVRYVRQGLIEASGVFPVRPAPVRFAVLFQWEQGRWKLFGVQIVPVEAATATKPAEPAQR